MHIERVTTAWFYSFRRLAVCSSSLIPFNNSSHTLDLDALSLKTNFERNVPDNSFEMISFHYYSRQYLEMSHTTGACGQDREKILRKRGEGQVVHGPVYKHL